MHRKIAKNVLNSIMLQILMTEIGFYSLNLDPSSKITENQ